jgi:hypothetical protein
MTSEHSENTERKNKKNTTVGMYMPPVSPTVRVGLVHLPPSFNIDTIGFFIGKGGKHLIRITEQSGVDYIWFENTFRWFEIWSENESCIQYATHLLYQEWFVFSPTLLPPLLPSLLPDNIMSNNIRIAILPNYSDMSFEVMHDTVIPWIVLLSFDPWNNFHGLVKVQYNPFQNWYEIWSTNEEMTQFILQQLHNKLFSLSLSSLSPPSPFLIPRLYFARTLDTHDSGLLDMMEKGVFMPQDNFYRNY